MLLDVRVGMLGADVVLLCWFRILTVVRLSSRRQLLVTVCLLGGLRKGKVLIGFNLSVSRCRTMLVSEECPSLGLAQCGCVVQLVLLHRC